jgi:hypothetical protein
MIGITDEDDRYHIILAGAFAPAGNFVCQEVNVFRKLARSIAASA